MSGTESKVFRSKIYKAFKRAPMNLIETGSGTCIGTGERDYGFITRDGTIRYDVTRLRNGKFSVIETKEKVTVLTSKAKAVVA